MDSREVKLLLDDGIGILFMIIEGDSNFSTAIEQGAIRLAEIVNLSDHEDVVDLRVSCARGREGEKKVGDGGEDLDIVFLPHCSNTETCETMSDIRHRNSAAEKVANFLGHQGLMVEGHEVTFECMRTFVDELTAGGDGVEGDGFFGVRHPLVVFKSVLDDTEALLVELRDKEEADGSFDISVVEEIDDAIFEK